MDHGVCNISSIHINGQNQGSFLGGKGLRQGDALSPLLFVITMEYFSKLMYKASQSHGFKFHPNCKALGLTHLMFTDDFILFCKAGHITLGHIMTALKRFHESADLKANQSKSQMVLGGCSAAL